MIDKYGEDIEIYRANKLVIATKTAFQTGNKLHLKPDIDIKSGDEIHRLRIKKILYVNDINPVLNEYIEVKYSSLNKT